jgi:antitoxin MazE
MGAKMKTERRRERMGLVVSKWGNSLAVRLPAAWARQLGVGEGDTLLGEIAPGGRLILSAEARAVGKAETKRMREFLARQKVTTPVVADLRRSARY